MKEEIIVYKSQGTECKGFLVYDPALAAKRPAVMVAHAWRGQDEFARQKARQLAEMGYVAFAADVFGYRTTASTDERAHALITPLFLDRKILRERIVSAYETVKALDVVDATRVGAIGFCFGGLTVIELLRSGVDLRGVVSFHGILGDTMGDLKAKTIPPATKLKGAILLLHGYEDPLVSQQDIANLFKELTEVKVDWQMHIYGHTTHAFTNPEAADPKGTFMYSPKADKRSWQSMTNFFEEVFT